MASTEPGARADGGRLPIGRLLRAEVLIASAFALLIGVTRAGEFGFGLGKFGGLEYLARVLALSATREAGPGICSTACSFALLDWTHRAPPARIQPELLRAAPWLLLSGLALFPFAVSLELGAGFAVAHSFFGVAWTSVRALVEIRARDIAFGYGLFLVSLALRALFLWFALPRVGRHAWGLPHKVGMLIAVSFAFNFLLGLIF